MIVSEITALTFLVANVIWDMFCLASMTLAGFDCWVPHWSLWTHHEDRTNSAAKILFAALVALNGLVRLMVVATIGAWWFAVMTYVVEGGLLLICGMNGHMRPLHAIGAGLLCVACAAVMFWAISEQAQVSMVFRT